MIDEPTFLDLFWQIQILTSKPEISSSLDFCWTKNQPQNTVLRFHNILSIAQFHKIENLKLGEKALNINIIDNI